MIGKRLHDVRNGAVVIDVVGIQIRENFAACLCESGIDRGRLTGIASAGKCDAVAPAVENFQRPVRAAAVHDDVLDTALPRHAHQSAFDELSLLIRRGDHRDEHDAVDCTACADC